MRSAVFAVALLLAGLPAFAADQKPDNDARAILAEQAQIRSEAMARKGRYKDMPEAQRTELFAHQDTVTRLLQDVDKPSDLSENEKLAVFNALEAVEAIVNKAEDERMVCVREKPLGSNRPERVCKTVAQRREEKLKADGAVRSTVTCQDGFNGGFCNN
jgi:hypothetical protein